MPADGEIVVAGIGDPGHRRIMQNVLNKLGLTEDNPGVFFGEWCGSGAKIDKISPIDGKKIASFRTASAEEYETAIARAHEAFLKWRVTPGPVRGATVRRLGYARHLGERKNNRGRRRRSAGDDRYL